MKLPQHLYFPSMLILLVFVACETSSTGGVAYPKTNGVPSIVVIDTSSVPTLVALDSLRSYFTGVQIVKGERGEKGEPGEPGPKGEKGDADSPSFPALRPFKTAAEALQALGPGELFYYAPGSAEMPAGTVATT